MKKWLALLLLPAFLFSQNKEETLKPEDNETLVEVKTLNDLIQSKEIEEEKKVEQQEEKKEPLTEKKEETKEETKDKMIEPVKEEKKQAIEDKEVKTKSKTLKIAKQEKKNTKNFDGKLLNDDLFVEKKGKNIILWIKKKPQVLSVALISAGNWKIKGQFFLRSPEKIADQKDNTLWYNGLPLGNDKKLYFLASSAAKKHPLLGSAYRIIIPETVTFGYNKNTAFKDIKSGKTEIIIRLFKKTQGQGGYQDNRYKIPFIDNSALDKPELLVSRKEAKGNLVGLSLIYQGNSANIKQITVETEKDEILLHDFAKGLTYPKYFQITQMTYNKDQSLFKMKLIVIFNIKKNKQYLLKVKTDKDTHVFPIDFDAQEQPKKDGIETKEESSKKPEEDKKETSSVKEPEKKQETEKEPKKEEKKEVKAEEPKKDQNLPDELNLKVQGQENK